MRLIDIALQFFAHIDEGLLEETVNGNIDADTLFDQPSTQIAEKFERVQPVDVIDIIKNVHRTIEQQDRTWRITEAIVKAKIREVQQFEVGIEGLMEAFSAGQGASAQDREVCWAEKNGQLFVFLSEEEIKVDAGQLLDFWIEHLDLAEKAAGLIVAEKEKSVNDLIERRRTRLETLRNSSDFSPLYEQYLDAILVMVYVEFSQCW
jgi:hypothetical protein